MLRIAHIANQTIPDEAEIFGEEVLRPKWEAMAKAAAIKRFKKHGIIIIDDTPFEDEPKTATRNGRVVRPGDVLGKKVKL